MEIIYAIIPTALIIFIILRRAMIFKRLFISFKRGVEISYAKNKLAREMKENKSKDEQEQERLEEQEHKQKSIGYTESKDIYD